MAHRFHLFTLGCKVNQYETQSLREAWTALGLAEIPFPEQADVIVINSCAVTAKAVADTRAAVRRLHRAAPEAALIVTGCAAQVQAAELEALPGVVKVLGQKDKECLLPGPDGLLSGNFPETSVSWPAFAVSGYRRSRAVLKIQDGCSHGCAYCIVPLARGGARSRPFVDSLAEARRLLEAGFREIVISGVNLRQYVEGGAAPSVFTAGDSQDFWNFLSRLDAALAPDWAGRVRFRLSSLEPGQLGQRALDVLASCKLIAPQLHISLQSGSPGVLERMRRGHYDPTGLPVFLDDLRRIWPVFGLGADILTAFPGETDAEFAEGLDLIRRLPLSYAHVFPYSIRPGTKAAVMPGQIAADVKKERAAILRGVVRDKKSAFLRSLLDVPRLHVVFESGEGREAGESLRGVCEYYADCEMLPAAGGGSPRLAPGYLAAVRPVDALGDRLLVCPADAGETPCP